MSVSGLAEIWSLEIPEDVPTAAALNIGMWAVNQLSISRVVAGALADQLSITPPSETRLRDEGIGSLYNIFRNIVDTLKSRVRELGVAAPDIPNVPEDWREDASNDWKALGDEIRPHLVEPMRATIDWILALRDRDPKLHWASRVAITSVSCELYVRMTQAVSGVLEGSEWQPFVAQVTGDELKATARVIDEEILRIRAQPGSGWDEEEAKRVAKEQVGNKKELTTAGM